MKIGGTKVFISVIFFVVSMFRTNLSLYQTWMMPLPWSRCRKQYSTFRYVLVTTKGRAVLVL